MSTLNKVMTTFGVIVMIQSCLKYLVDGKHLQEPVWKSSVSPTQIYTLEGIFTETVKGVVNQDQTFATVSIVDVPISQKLKGNETFQFKRCTRKEKDISRCVSGQGECFVYVIAYHRRPTCHCKKRYAGTRCEELNFDLLFPSTERGLYSGIVIIVVIATVVAAFHVGLIILCFRCFRRRQNHVNRARIINGNECLPENHTQVIADMGLNWNGKYVLNSPTAQTMELTPTPV